ncbi:MAG: family 10 glycosylhydrolase [Pseudanabaenaceae cyanobacterium]
MRLCLAVFVSMLTIAPPLVIAQADDPLVETRPPSRPVPLQRGITLILRPDTADWQQLSRALPATGYTVLPLSQLNETVLNSAQTVFLPNPETLTEAQLQVLEAWVGRGGRLIVTGAIGQNGDLSMRDRLRRLLGGIWQANLDRDSKLFLRAGEAYDWQRLIPNLTTTEIRQGGKLQAGAGRVIAYWQTNDPAILAQGTVYYLGWQWGTHPEQQAFDRSWFLALVNAPASLHATGVPDDRPLTTVEVTAMRQELQDLIGRVESAILASNKSLSSNAEQAIESARQLLRQLPQMVGSARFSEARQAWEQARLQLWQNYPVEILTAKSEVRAIWLDRATIVAAGSEQGLARIFDRLQNAGVNTVFLETINAGYPIYPSRVAPEQNPAINGWDPLASAIRLARQRRMELHAWVWVYSAGNQRHNPIVNKPDNYPGPVLARYPQWANLNRQGSPFTPEAKTFLDPANPEVEEYLLRLYREIVTNYDIDGLHIDYIRYPRQDPGHDFGFGLAGRQKFMELTGIDPIHIDRNDHSLWWLWTEFRTRQVNQFVARLSREMRRLKPGLVISAAVFPWHTNDRLQRIQQNWELWVSRGDVDLLTPMTYVPDTAIFLRQRVLPSLEYMGKSPVLFLPGVFIRDVVELELLDQLQAVRDLPAGGFALFAAEHLRPSVENALKRTRIDENAKIIPFRQPFAAARVRFKVLQQEWQPLLNGESHLVRGENLRSWQRQTQQLQRTLTSLSDRPSPEAIRTALSQIDSLTADLPRWLKLVETYRVNTWINRLRAIATILRFGEFRLTLGIFNVAER